MSVNEDASDLDKDVYEEDGLDPLGPHMAPHEQWSHYTRYFYLLCKVAFFAVAIYAVYLVLTSLSSVIFPLFISLLIAYLLDPLVDVMEERRIPRTVGILICLLGILLLVFVVSMFLYPTLARQIGNVVDRVPKLIELIQTKTIPWVEDTFEYKVPPTFTEAVVEYSNELKNAAPSVLKKAGEWATGLVSQTGAIVVSLLNAIMIPIFTFYFLRDFDKITATIGDLLPNYRRGFLQERIELMDTVVGEWFRGQLQVAGILAILYSIGLSIVFSLSGIDVNSGIAIGLVTGLLNVIPYFGVAIGVILSLLVVVLEWVGFMPVLGVVIVFVVVQTLEGYFITPKIVGEKVGLSPVTVIIVLLLGGEMFGLIGILLAIPVAGAIKVILPDLIEYYKSSPFFTGRNVHPAPSRVTVVTDDDREFELTTHASGETQIAPIAADAARRLQSEEESDSPEPDEGADADDSSEDASGEEIAEASESDETGEQSASDEPDEQDDADPSRESSPSDDDGDAGESDQAKKSDS
jgi:predicted PurR-regulated permease PerM